MKKLFTLLTMLVLGIGISWGQVITTWNGSLIESLVTRDQLVASAETGQRYAFRMPSTSKPGWCDFVNVSSSSKNSININYLFTIENGSNSGKYKLKRCSDGKYLSGNAKFNDTGIDLTLTNRTPTNVNDYESGLSNSSPFVSFDNSAGNHYNCGNADFRGGTGGWSVYVTVGPLYIVTINCKNSATNETIRTDTYIVKDGTEINAPKSFVSEGKCYNITSDHSVTVNGSDITSDVNYTELTRVDALNDLNNSKKYVIYNNRGVWAVDNNATEINSTHKDGLNLEFSASDTKQQFAFIYYDATDNDTDDGSYYLYSIGESKFAYIDGTKLSLTADFTAQVAASPVTFAASTSSTYATSAPVVIQIGNQSFGVSPAKTPDVYKYSPHLDDDGNASAIYEAGDFDPQEALEKIYNYIISELEAYTYDTGVGNYHVTDGDKTYYSEVYSIISGLKNSGYSEENLTTAQALLNATSINQPEAGKTYAFRGIADLHQYMIGAHSTVTGKSDRLALAASPQGNSHIFTLTEDNKLQAYTNNFYIVNNNGFLNLGDEDAEGVAFEFTPASQKGAYLLKFMNGETARSPYSQFEGYIDGGGWSADLGIGYQWEIVEVEPKTTSNITYNYYIGEDKVYECVRECRIGEPYPTPEFPSGAHCSTDFYSISTPEGDVPDEDGNIDITITQNLPFTASPSFEDAVWHVLKLKHGDFKYQYYEDGQTKIPQTVSKHDYSDKYLFCFVGNIVSGFKIYNRLAGDNMILSATTTMTDHVSGGSTYGDADPYAIMVELTNGVVPDGNNTYWDVTASSYATNGFFLGQHGYPNQRLNRRSNYLAFWSGGADAGSTFVAEEITKNGLLTNLNGYRSLEQITLEDDVTELIYPDEYSKNNFTPQQLNTAIAALGDVTEESTFDDIKTFAGSEDFRIVKKFKELSDLHGAPLSVTYEHKRPYGTLIMPINFSCPEDWVRYSCSELDGGQLVLTEYSGGATKNVPYIIYAPDKTNHKYQFIGYQNGAGTQNVTSGCLTGVLSDETTTVPSGSYVLAYDKTTLKQSFRKTNGSVVCPKYKVYLTKPAEGQSRDAFFFPDFNDDPTGLYELLEQTFMTDGKYVRNGRIIIMKDGVKYNTNGQIIK